MRSEGAARRFARLCMACTARTARSHGEIWRPLAHKERVKLQSRTKLLENADNDERESAVPTMSGTAQGKRPRLGHTRAILGADLQARIASVKVLLVGAGGIGCELREWST